MKDLFKICLSYILGLGMLHAQYTVKDINEIMILKNLPQEKVFLDHTGPLLFSGDYLYYTFECFNVQNHNYTTVSKVGYVALINEAKQIILEQKISLDKGRSQGDFFIGTEIPSGNYKLIGYTNWMMNNGLEQIFKDDLVIINPYRADQSVFLKAEEFKSINPSIKSNLEEDKLGSSILKITLDKKSYSQREKASLQLTNYKDNLGHGIYNIKVRKLNDIPVFPSENAINFAEDALKLKKSINKNIGDKIFLPEQKGELVGGTLYKPGTDEIVPNMSLIVSIPGEDFILKTVTTNKDGEFYVYLDKKYEVSKMIVQQLDATDSFDIKFKAKGEFDVTDLEFNSFELRPEYENTIKQRSIHNQIANQFFMISPDSLYLERKRPSYDGALPETIILDEFTRFATLGETIIELYHNVSYRNNPNGNDFIRMEMKEGIFEGYYEPKPAIVLIDGVYIPNHELIKDFDATKIESIDLIRDIHRIGNKEYQGLMAIKTFDRDYYDIYNTTYGSIQDLNAPLPQKKYYKQIYSGGDQYHRVPDYRYLLFWQPKIEVKDYKYNFEFFTSDLKGEFEVVLNGFTSYGKPITLKETFRVE